jgi:tetratricopeptide (TPR) repeat protein
MKLAPDFFMSRAIMEPLYFHRGERAKALEVARETLEGNPSTPKSLSHVRMHEFRAGRYKEARALYERGYPGLLQEAEPTIDHSNYEAAIDLALVLSRTGEQERADLLLDDSLAFIRTIPRLGAGGYSFSDVMIYALQGYSEAALTALRQAIDEGLRTSWWFYLEHNPNLDSIRDEPEFQGMLDEVKADMAAQLERVRAMEANGELEPIPDVD